MISNIPIAVLLLLCLQQSRTTSSFVPQSTTRLRRRIVYASTPSKEQKVSTITSVPEISDALVQLLLSWETNKDLERTLANQLIDAKVTFDPTECFDGPLYFSNVIEGPSPLWERLGLSSSNIQGQQYTYNDKEKTVINYAEIFGSALHLRAYGTYERDMSSLLWNLESESAAEEVIPSFLDNVLCFFKREVTRQAPASGKSIQCPADFVVTVNKASIFMGAKNLINIPISGKGYLRVLYADPRLRIFVSPKSTTDDRWEKAGLKVAQICIDIKDPDFERLS